MQGAQPTILYCRHTLITAAMIVVAQEKEVTNIQVYGADINPKFLNSKPGAGEMGFVVRKPQKVN